MFKKALNRFLILFALILFVQTPSTFGQQPIVQTSNEDLKAKIFPSEIKDGYFFVAIPEQTDIIDLEINIVNLIGSKIDFSIQKMTDGKFRIEMNGATSGIYIIRIAKDKKQTIQKIVVRSN